MMEFMGVVSGFVVVVVGAVGGICLYAGVYVVANFFVQMVRRKKF